MPGKQEPSNMRGGKPHTIGSQGGRVHESKTTGGGSSVKGVNRRTGSASKKC